MAQDFSQVPSHPEVRLGAAPDVKLAILVPEGADGVRLDVALVHRGGVVLVLHDHVGLGKSLLHVAHLEGEARSDVGGLAGGLPHAAGEQVLVQQRGVVLHGIHHVHHRGQVLVLHPDELDGLLGHVGVDSGHRRHGMALVEHLVAGQDVVALELETLVSVAELLAGEGGEGKVPCRHHRLDAGVSLGLAGVDGLDAGMGVGAAQDFTMQQAGELDVGAVLGASGDFIHTVGPDGALADDLVLHLREDYVGGHVCFTSPSSFRWRPARRG